ncbi:hypothetical protein P171DRAFT_428995 [Karstenula rhodostoma CBS 690.94]|uniref:NAD(P)-binding protein n=1 Tax=Karstenula rhodostoma CBS 690.94 TaxID=1392251 RepID=A0A9P4UGZ1_9PLEO|nr:hypothetical protein P171DRAFT_428995 [Karstenula rhodostoma CBS 690.94]
MTTQTPVWFITATSSGFGYYTALEALASGHHVIASGRTLYYSTKWAVSGLSEAMREELASFGILITDAEPGAFRKGFLVCGGGDLLGGYDSRV